MKKMLLVGAVATTPFEEFAVAVGRDPRAQFVGWADRGAAEFTPETRPGSADAWILV